MVTKTHLKLLHLFCYSQHYVVDMFHIEFGLANKKQEQFMS